MMYERNDEDYYIRKARAILENRVMDKRKVTNPEDMKQYLTLHLQGFDREVFGIAYLTTRHTIIHMHELFFGTLDSCTVHPREIVKEALKRGAGAVIAYHNHPSGDPEPSLADKTLTARIKDALSLVEIRLLDHFVLGGTQCVSFSERGYL